MADLDNPYLAQWYGYALPASGSSGKKPGPDGQTEAGNIDLMRRPVVRNPDGSISTVRSMSVNFGNGEVLIPTVSDDGRLLSNEDAIALYRRTGKHLGIFDTPQNATSYAERLHESQARTYAAPARFSDAQMEHIGLINGLGSYTPGGRESGNVEDRREEPKDWYMRTLGSWLPRGSYYGDLTYDLMYGPRPRRDQSDPIPFETRLAPPMPAPTMRNK